MKKSQQDVEIELIAITNKLLEESGEARQKHIRLDASLQRHLGIDSLTRAELFSRIEKNFDVRLSDRLLAEAETLNDIVDALVKSESGIKRIQKKEKRAAHDARPDLDAGSAKTLIDILMLYGENARDLVHLYFQNEEGMEEIVTYGDLLSSAKRVASGLRSLGLKEGETVAVMQPSHPNFFYTFFGILLAGGIPVPIYPPFRMHLLEAYAQTEARILSNAEVRILVTFTQAEKLSLLLKSFVPSLKHVTTVDALIKSDEITEPFHAEPHHSAFIQYTSGSTADPKGVLLDHANLLANIRAYGQAIKVRRDDVAVSWLPLYHDMGLIGMWLGSLYYGLPLVLMTPFSFLNHPERWLWTIHYYRGTLTGAPNFAYELCIRKIDKGLLEGLDLSSLRMTANGAEKVFPRTLDEFVKKFSPYGFKKEALLPVYGLAESTVALAISPVEKGYCIDKVNRRNFEEKRLAEPDTGKSALSFVACGLPIEEHEIRIVDEDINVLDERHVGRLQFRGPSTMRGYFNNPKATEAIYYDGWLDSGDLAYIANGEVYITGRCKDLIIKAGRNIYPAEIEELTEKVEGVRQGCVAAFEVLDINNGTEEMVVVAETRETSKARRKKIVDDIRDKIAAALDLVPDHIMLVAPHIVPKTSSGKLQRAACKNLYIQDRLGKSQLPPSLQIVRLFLSSTAQKCMKGVKLTGRFIYTLYIALLIGISFFPLYFWVKYVSRDLAAKTIKIWSRWLLRFAFCSVKVVGTEKLLNSSVIYAANHASYIDSVLMAAVLPETTRIVVKKELFSMPFIRTFMKKLDYPGIDRLDFSKGLEDTKHIEKVLKAGYPILIFPEGTFGYAAGLRPFRLGAFKIAAETGLPISAVAIKGARYIQRDDEILIRPNHVTITICDPVKSEGAEWQDVTKLRNAVRQEMLKYCGEPSLDFIAGQTVAES